MPFDVTNIHLCRLYFITDNCCESCFKRRSIGLTWTGEIYISAVKPVAPAVWWPRAWLTARNFYEWRPSYRTVRRIVNRFNMGRSIYVRHWGLLALVFQLPFNISKCPGPDGGGVHPRPLQDEEYHHLFISYTKYIYKPLVHHVHLPDEWKHANITAIDKKENKNIPGNYRPISLTSIICKLLEKPVRNSIVNYTKTNNWFTRQQFGFIGGRSTATDPGIGKMDQYPWYGWMHWRNLWLWFHESFWSSSASSSTGQTEVLWYRRTNTQVDCFVPDQQKATSCGEQRVLGMARCAPLNTARNSPGSDPVCHL